MRVVGRVHEVIVAEEIDRVAGRYLVGLDRGHALPLEVRARHHRQLAHVEVALELVGLVKTPEQPRQPGAIRLQEGHLQRRMALEDAAAQQAAHGVHLPDGLPECSMDP